MAPRAGLLLAALALLLAAAPGSTDTGVFQVRRKYPAGGDAGGNITALRAHDGRRHRRLLAAADLKLGGLGLPTDTGYYRCYDALRGVWLISFWGLIGMGRRAQALFHGDQSRDAAQALLPAGRHRQRHPLG